MASVAGVRPEKAFLVETDDPEESVVRFATTNVAARREGANAIGTDFNMVSCKRLPWADKFAGGRVPESAYIENGWWFECATCSERVDNDTKAPVFALDLVFCCEKCHCAEVADRNAAEGRKQELIDALLAKFPGVEVTYASNHDERRIANFKFPGGKDQATWVLGEDTVSVATSDVEAWNAWRAPFRAQEVATPKDATNPASSTPRWTFACTRCPWTGNNPDTNGVGHFADCPSCGHSCTTDEASFEPAAGLLDNNA